ncbi:hypothetical protein [Streptomyces sp. NPDC001815]|uniref:hypothetical protein n=1 Tax=Streptomyces sp. NPDC001815 TaxID=3154526 RepID=UPI003332B902
MGIELDRVLARLRESDGVENVVMGDVVACDALAALAIVDPKWVDRDVESLSGAVAH